MECRAGQNQQGIIEQMQKGHQGITKSTECRRKKGLHKRQKHQKRQKHKRRQTIIQSPSFHTSRFGFHLFLFSPEAETPRRTLPWKSHCKRNRICCCSLRRSNERIGKRNDENGNGDENGCKDTCLCLCYIYIMFGPNLLSFLDPLFE